MSLRIQIRALALKTLKILITRNTRSTIYSALVLPIMVCVYLGIGQNFTQPDSRYGIGKPADIFSLPDALSKAGGHRNTVVFVNSGHTGGDIDKAITSLSAVVRGAGKNATLINDESDLGYVCKGSIRGTSNCFGAVVFYSSPSEGHGGYWNYTLRADAGLGDSFTIDQKTNDAEVYVLPLQHAVDAAIIGSSFPANVQQYPYTSETEDEREAEVRRQYQSAFVKYLSVAFIIALIGVCYHMPGFIATERENGMSQLIDAMMPVKQGWHRQLVRLMSFHLAFTATYMPGWIAASIVCGTTIWKHTSFGILIVFFIFSGLAITSMSLLSATFFKKAQLSGVITAVIWIALGIVAQAIPKPGTAAVTILSLLFTPCNYVFFIKNIARYEQESRGANLLHSPSSDKSRLPGIAQWIFFLLQLVVYPMIAAYVERVLHGVSTTTRISTPENDDRLGGDAIRIENMTKIYRPSLIRRFFSFVSPPRPEVIAVRDLTLTTKKGEILALLGANGSGKSTTLDAISGISNITGGTISVDTSGGLGFAPQKNVIWDELSVFENIQIFGQLKAPTRIISAGEIESLINAIGLQSKIKSRSKTLSGGQKRKLQLGMMLIGGSAVCCVDEVSSGIDPLSRKKIWDILLAERGSRTIIMTTHFLDEADLLADKIAVMSKGTLRAQGSSAELKDTLGAGYHVHVLNPKEASELPKFDGVHRKVTPSSVTYISSSSRQAADVIRALESAHIPYKFSGPTIEDVFLHLAEEVQGENLVSSVGGEKDKIQVSQNELSQKESVGDGLFLLSGKQTSMVHQTAVLFRKRLTVFKTNWIPYLAAFIIPIIAAAITQLLVRHDSSVGCSPAQRSTAASTTDFTNLLKTIHIVGGPSSKFNESSLVNLFKPEFPQVFGSGSGSAGVGNLSLTLENSFSSFQSYIKDNHETITPAALWLGDSSTPPTVSYRADNFSMFTAAIAQNLLDAFLANATIVTTYKSFDYPVAPNTGDGLQLVVYFAIACSIFPGLFGLYPNAERTKNIRGLQYSSGVRTLPVWVAHLAFDFSIIFVSMMLAAAIFVGASNVWYHGGYLFPVLMLYGLTTIIVSYFVSLIMGTTLSTFAITAVIQALGFAIYLISYLFILTYSPASNTDRDVLISHWVIAAIFPTGSLIRALMIAQNVFSVSCEGDALQSNPAALVAYGGPILYLVLQSLFWFSMVIWVESGAGRHSREKATRTPEIDDPEIADEVLRIDDPGNRPDGLQVSHLTKAFGKNTAVDNVSFGIEHGEVFALLGPNGAGKSTTISLIRGDIAPSRRGGGDVFIENASITKKRAAARANLGVCPQFDAIDNMTVTEHLEHYSRLRGISDVKHQVPAVIRAVGLGAYAHVMAHTLSGGNKRKLSLGIALTGNPPVILLDEPSSGLDAAAKRIMWRTLETIVPGRSILLTTHSMEEADALATRAGIMAKRMLALGTTEKLRQRFGDTLHVHLVSKTAPHSTQEEMDQLRAWVIDSFPSAEVEQQTYHGQMRFSIPASNLLGKEQSKAIQTHAAHTQSAIGRLLITLEENKEKLGVAHHSVSPTTLNEVFLNIVGQHDVQEEGYRVDQVERKWWYPPLLWKLLHK